MISYTISMAFLQILSLFILSSLLPSSSAGPLQLLPGMSIALTAGVAGPVEEENGYSHTFKARQRKSHLLETSSAASPRRTWTLWTTSSTGLVVVISDLGSGSFWSSFAFSSKFPTSGCSLVDSTGSWLTKASSTIELSRVWLSSMIAATIVLYSSLDWSISTSSTAFSYSSLSSSVSVSAMLLPSSLSVSLILTNCRRYLSAKTCHREGL